MGGGRGAWAIAIAMAVFALAVVTAIAMIVTWVEPVGSFFEGGEAAQTIAWEGLTAATVVTAALYSLFEFGYRRGQLRRDELTHEQNRLAFDQQRLRFDQEQDDRHEGRVNLAVAVRFHVGDAVGVIIDCRVENRGHTAIKIAGAPENRPRLLITLYDDVVIEALATRAQGLEQLVGDFGHRFQLLPFTDIDGSLRHTEIEPGATIRSSLGFIVPKAIGPVTFASAQFIFTALPNPNGRKDGGDERAEVLDVWTTDALEGAPT